jgi:WD40 repeat protein
MNPVGVVAFSADGKNAFTAGADGKVCRWDAATGKELSSGSIADPLSQRYSSFAISFDHKYLACGSYSTGISLRELATGKEVCEFEGIRTEATAIAFSADGTLLAAGGRDKAVRVWDVATGQALSQLKLEMPIQTFNGEIRAVAFAPDGKTLAAASNSFAQPSGSEVYVWSLADGKEVCRIKLPQVGVQVLTFAPDSKWLATGGQGGTIHFWNAATGKEVRQLAPGPRGVISTLAFSADGRNLVCGSYDYSGQVNKVQLFEVATGDVRAVFDGHRGAVSSLAFAPDGKTLATGGRDTTVLLWDLTGNSSGAYPKKLAAKELEELWSALALDTPRAYQAGQRLTAAPADSVPLLQKQLRPVAGKTIDPKQVEKLIAQLDDGSFAVRDRANRDLQQLGKAAQAALLRALKGNPTPEVRRRVELLLSKLEETAVPADLLRPLRALEILERIGTAEARQVLAALAEGDPGAALTQQAQAALERLQRRDKATR